MTTDELDETIARALFDERGGSWAPYIFTMPEPWRVCIPSARAARRAYERALNAAGWQIVRYNALS